MTPVRENASFSIRANFESGANRADVSALQKKKPDSPMNSIEGGKSIEINPDHANAAFSIPRNFEFVSNVTDIRLLQEQNALSQISSTEAGI